MRDLIKAQCVSLSLWNCQVDGEVYSANGDKFDNNMLMVYYFNLGVDARIGLQVERNRTSRRCCNYIWYFLFSIPAMLGWDYSDARN